jgi:phosphate transport system protein
MTPRTGNTGSISSDLIERSQGLLRALAAQGKSVQAMLEMALDALFARDTEKARLAIAADDAVDKADVRIEQESVRLLADATRQHAELDEGSLRAVLTIVKANNELERVADCAVDVAELVEVFAKLAAPFPPTFRVMANSVVGILRDTVLSLEKGDATLARIVLQSQHTVTAFKSAILREAEQQLARGTMPADLAFHLHEVATLCEIVADHCTNIAEQVIYQKTGAIVRHTQTNWVDVQGGG